MKTIIIVLLLSWMLIGQVLTDDTTGIFDKSEFRLSYWDWEKEYFVLAILLLYDEYEQECYADSTFVISDGGYEHKFVAVNDTLDLTRTMSIPAIHIVKRRWEHRQPTFQGFIEFIRRKKDEVNK